MSRRKRRQPQKMGLTSLILLLLLLILAVLFDVDIEELFALATTSAPPQTVSVGGDWYTIYFTDPTCPPEEERRGGLNETVAGAIQRAKVSVDLAAFDLDAEPIINALINRELAGLPVRVVVDDENTPLTTLDRLRTSGIGFVGDERSALMHNKFAIIDGRDLWVGSMNFTSNGAYCNNNNLVHFEVPALAANYGAEMNEMFVERSFGPTSPFGTEQEQLNINGVLVESYFASEREVAPIVAEAVAGAQDEILFLAFSFTNEQIGEAVLGRAEAGVTVRGVFENTGSETAFSYYPPMRDLGLPVRQDGNSRLMHHKVIIIDRRIVLFGSFNFTASANDNNDENLLIVHDPAFAAPFVEEFERVWNEAR